ncbi:hypothetical protein ebA3226 [Aromatoleum aromaticum EbN1]|uniref:Uncharacterized protein n=1 Tax=Aromatoleum aromaticum (strain DSM 19018 / LMG 30748 / EbN1) TaxID=76114 RepID=Q5P422_AROAE|nr:hypothetical protein ebA3226 [Aromatoleum aromaticum EbN1]
MKTSGYSRCPTEKCKPIGSKMFKRPNSEYSDLEFSMTNRAVEFMKKIDGVL